MKVTDTYLKEIIDFGMDGVGVAKDEMPIFIPFAVKGDLCKIKINEVKKNFATGKLVKVVRPSDCRIEPKCGAFYDCGGCVYQNIDFLEENKVKKELLSRTLKKAGVDVDVEDTIFDNEYGYRNKLQLPFAQKDGKVVLGFYKRGTHEVIPLSKCILNGEWAEKIISLVTFWANDVKLSAYNEESHIGILRHLVVRRVNDFYFITLVINGKSVKYVDKLYLALKKEINCTLYISVNEKHNNVIMGDSAKLVCGEEKYVDIDGLRVVLSPMSFLQVNDVIRRKLYDAVSNEISDADYIFDVFSGVGLLTAKLAINNKDAKVFGLEIVKEAVENADTLMKDNGLDDRVKNICGDATIELPKLTNKLLSDNNGILNTKICTVIDPPRKGAGEKVLDAIVRSNSSKVVYISCNPATLSRDLMILNNSYKIIKVTPFNMFPRTSELETLVILERR